MNTEIPAEFKYTADHEWLDVKDGIAKVGVTAFAADALGDVVFVELPRVGSRLIAGTTCGEIESTKSVSELYAPVDGEVTRLNQAVVDDPGLINADPFGEGWLFEQSMGDVPDLLTADAYLALVANG